MTDKLKIIPLGGLGEIGLNMMAFEYEDTIIVVDCGLMFPEDYMLGIDIVIPDVSYLIENKDKVKAFFITHGHEDHVGALPFVLKEVNAPIYATMLTIGLIENKLNEHNLLKQTTFESVRPRDVVEVGPFSVEPIRVCHSIVDAVSYAITTPIGTVIHTGDFKIDQTPVDGELLDFARFSDYGEKGVLALLSDSTNVESEGYSLSESKVGEYLDEIFSNTTGRIIVAAFSSNIHRMQQVINTCKKYGRKLAVNGRSMIANIRIARSLGYLSVPDGVIVDVEELKELHPERVALLTTGSQGEPMSVLIRMAMDSHKHLKIDKGDTVILSSKFIPGNEKAISNMMNHLYRRGAEVIYEKVSEVHVSGHGSQEELKAMLNMTKPKCFVPVHGEYRHLVRHARLAMKTGVKEENVVVAEDGNVIELTKDGIAINGEVDSGRVFVDGKGVGDVGDMVLKDRRHLSRDGMVMALIALDSKTGDVLYGPDIVTRGLIFEEESEHLLDGAREAVEIALMEANKEVKTDTAVLTEEVRLALRRFFNKSLERKPVILPMVVEV